MRQKSEKSVKMKIVSFLCGVICADMLIMIVEF